MIIVRTYIRGTTLERLDELADKLEIQGPRSMSSLMERTNCTTALGAAFHLNEPIDNGPVNELSGKELDVQEEMLSENVILLNTVRFQSNTSNSFIHDYIQGFFRGLPGYSHDGVVNWPLGSKIESAFDAIGKNDIIDVILQFNANQASLSDLWAKGYFSPSSEKQTLQTVEQVNACSDYLTLMTSGFDLHIEIKTSIDLSLGSSRVSTAHVGHKCLTIIVVPG